jgi:hypothetical protein
MNCSIAIKNFGNNLETWFKDTMILNKLLTAKYVGFEYQSISKNLTIKFNIEEGIKGRLNFLFTFQDNSF